jgi:hypothetical protein
MKRVGSDLPRLLARTPVRLAPARAVLWFLVVAAAMIVGLQPVSAVTVCLDSDEQGRLVAGNEIVPVSAALNTRKVQKRGKLIEAKVCRNQKGFFYLMTMQSAEGEVKVVRVSAAPSAAQPDLQIKRNCYYGGRPWSTGSICKLECIGDRCPRQYCKANGEWQQLPRCEVASSCQAYRGC